MSYTYSRARKRYLMNIEDIVKTSKDADTANLCPSLRVRNLAHGSAIVLASAGVENYLEDLITDWARAIANPPLPVSGLPEQTRAFLLNGPGIRSAYRKSILLEQGESSVLEALCRHISDNGEFRFANPNSLVSPSSLYQLLRDSKYPSEENLTRLFNRCGIKNLFVALHTLAKRDVKPLLRSFGDVRTQLAHNGMPVGINGQDVRDRIKDVSAVVGYIDRLFYKHTKAMYGVASWTVAP